MYQAGSCGVTGLEPARTAAAALAGVLRLADCRCLEGATPGTVLDRHHERVEQTVHDQSDLR